ncbi:GAF domain-containing sensor histidine kinase [Flavobacterium pallidum]|uniref:histidine kinase n=1 Tax=Flavobacterium pallidum TaxID=2172098 RepID=A0A2S1SKX0_9FLAO|nr:ATP-binding protein [Flavobacterium pallidum]AWI27060.1 hypothetical protein HYN49_14755 [Flavobacterium pallidum]
MAEKTILTTDIFHTLFNSMDQGFCVLEMIHNETGKPADLLYLESNPAFDRIAGTAVTGKKVSDFDGRLQSFWFDIYQNVLNTGAPARLEYKAVETGCWYAVFVSRIGEEGSKQITGIFTDITERKLADERTAYFVKLNDATRYIQNPVALQQIAMQVLGEYLGVNRAFYGELQDDDTLVIGPGYADGLPPIEGQLSIDDFGSELMGIFNTGKNVVIHDLYSDSPILPTVKAAFDGIGIRAAIGVPLVKSGKAHAVLSVHQSEPRKWTENEIKLVEETAERTWAAVEWAKTAAILSESEQKYRTLFETIDDGFALVELERDASGKITDIIYRETNPAFELHTGLKDVIGKKVTGLLPNMSESVLKIIRQVADTGIPQRNEYYQVDLGRWYNVRHSRVGGPESAYVVAVFSDITARKNAEKELNDFNTLLETQVAERTATIRKNENDLRDTNKHLQLIINQLESFNHIASHDLQEPLRKIQIFASRLSETGQDDLRRGVFLEGIQNASGRMRNLIDDLLAYSRLGSKETFKRVDLNKTLEQVRNDYELLIADKKAVIESDHLPVISAVPFQMRQLFANLVSNSLKFSIRNPVIKISCRVAKGHDFESTFPLKPEMEYVQITFADNGIGFDNEYKDKIFYLFQRLPAQEKISGTGIGLSIVEKAVKEHQGFIDASGEKGTGAVFTIYLPLKQK